MFNQAGQGIPGRVRAMVFAVLIVLTGCPALAAKPYSLIDLGGIIGGWDFSLARDINNAGQVLGQFTTFTGTRLFMWDQANGLQSVDVQIDSGNTLQAFEINDLGQVLFNAIKQDYPTIYERHSYVWDANNGLREIAYPVSGYETTAIAINDHGQVAGAVDSDPTPLTGEIHACFWDENDNVIDIGELIGGTKSNAFDINNHGVVVGRAEGLRAASKAFRWDAVNGVQILDSLYEGSAAFTRAHAINDQGQIVGDSYNGISTHAFIWDETNGIVDLGDLFDGTANSKAVDINAAGQVIGYSDEGDGYHQFLWDPIHGMRDLGALIDTTGDGWQIEQIAAINDNGWIVGHGRSPSGRTHAFVLVPEPSTILLATMSLLVWRMRS